MMGTHLPMVSVVPTLLYCSWKKTPYTFYLEDQSFETDNTVITIRILSVCLDIVRIFLLHLLSFSNHTLPLPVSMQTGLTHPGRLCLLWLRRVCLMHVCAHCMSYRVPYVRPILAISSQRACRTAIRLPALCHKASWSCWRAPHCGVHHIVPPRQK